MTTKTVRKIGRIDFALTLITFMFVIVKFIAPLYPESELSSPRPVGSNTKFHKELDSGIQLQINHLGFWLIVAMIVIFALMGLAWSVVLVCVAGFRTISYEVRLDLLGWWLVVNSLIVGILISFGLLAFPNGSSERDHDMQLCLVTIMYSTLVLIRLIMMYKIYKEAYQMLKDGKFRNEDKESWFDSSEDLEHGWEMEQKY